MLIGTVNDRNGEKVLVALKRLTFHCLQSVAALLIVLLVPEFLNVHPFFDMVEQDVENAPCKIKSFTKN